MKLKNVLVAVEDMDLAVDFYRNLFGLQVVSNHSEIVILTEGLVLQDKKVWNQVLEQPVISKSHAMMLYFEERSIEAFVKKLDELYGDKIQYLTPLMTLSWGQQLVRFYDLDGNLIEVRTPME